MQECDPAARVLGLLMSKPNTCHEDEIRSVEGTEAGRGGPEGTAPLNVALRLGYLDGLVSFRYRLPTIRTESTPNIGWPPKVSPSSRPSEDAHVRSVSPSRK